MIARGAHALLNIWYSMWKNEGKDCQDEREELQIFCGQRASVCIAALLLDARGSTAMNTASMSTS